MGKKEILQFKPEGVCCQVMQVALDGNKIADAAFLGGCSGNLGGIRELIKGMTIDDVIERLGGIPCGPKLTSCPDQLARCLLEYKQKKLAKAK